MTFCLYVKQNKLQADELYLRSDVISRDTDVQFELVIWESPHLKKHQGFGKLKKHKNV